MIFHKYLSPIPSNKTAIAPTTQHPIAYFPHQTAIAPHHHPKPDRLFPQIKQRSPLITTQNPIAFSLKSNSDRPFTTHNPDRLFPQIKQRSPLSKYVNLS
jgi:hypothetical protein